MGEAAKNQEIEIKLRVEDAAGARALIEAAGCRETHPRTFERNVLFDTPEAALRSSERLLRLREYGAERLVTFKGKGVQGRHKIREEVEVTVSSGENLGLILERLGYYPSFLYEKYRTEFEDIHGGGKALLDETPIGVFIELEGAPEWIDRTAAAMGFAVEDYVLASYGTLYMEYCVTRGRVPANMIFEESGN